MRVTVWSDYVCPWAYLGTASYQAIERLGGRVDPRPFELHPEWGPDGIALSAPARDRWASRFAPLLEEAGLAFVAPRRVPRSRPALEFAEAVRAVAAERFGDVHRALFDAHFVRGVDLSDSDVLFDIATRAGIDAALVATELGTSRPATEVLRSREAATEAGVTGTPAWYLDDRLLLPGAQPPAVFERILGRLASS